MRPEQRNVRDLEDPPVLQELSVRTFKSLADITVELGTVNVFIGANGSGKSNLLEALGVLSAAADGKVDDQSLLSRGVRPGVPALYKSAFPANGQRIPPHLYFAAQSELARYQVTLHNPLKDPSPAWRFKTEFWGSAGGGDTLVSRSPSRANESNAERGLAALKAVVVDDGPALDLLRRLQSYAIFTPTTPVLRGVAPESQPRRPIGLSGGGLPQAILEMLALGSGADWIKGICDDALELIDWAKGFGSSPSARLALSPSAAASDRVIQFRDKFMRDGSFLSGYDASEGALFVLFLAVICGHPNVPLLAAIDNADHGLNPRLAKGLIERVCRWLLDATEPRQIIMTTHNPLVLDGLPLQEDRVRLFTVSRTNTGRTSVRRVRVDDKLIAKADKGWTLSRLWTMGHLGGVPDV